MMLDHRIWGRAIFKTRGLAGAVSPAGDGRGY